MLKIKPNEYQPIKQNKTLQQMAYLNYKGKSFTTKFLGDVLHSHIFNNKSLSIFREAANGSVITVGY